MKSTIVWIVIIVIVLLGGWYWYSMQGEGVPAEDEISDEVSDTVDLMGRMETGEILGPVLNVANDATLGDYLVAANGMTLYMYTKDEAGISNCSGTCAENWLPYTIAGNENLEGGEGVTGELGAIARGDSSVQLTYNDMPLYISKNDTKPGDTTGHEVNDVWFVVKP